MSESNSDHSANSNPDEGAGPASSLPHVDSPSMAPDDGAGMPAETAKSEAAKSEAAKSEAAKSEAAKSEMRKSEMHRSEITIPQSARSEPVAPLTATRGTALVVAIPRAEEAGPAPEPASRPTKSRRFAFAPAASMVAVLLGAAVGSAATAGLLYLNLNAAPTAAPADPTAFTASFDRINRELATLKASVDGSAKQSNAQVAKIADRMERAEKGQADTTAKLARTAESLDRLERRLAAPAAAGDITGSLPTGTLGTLPAGPGDRTAALADPKRAAPAQPAILEGWVLRDVFNGAAMIQTPRNGILEVIPGDTLPGLGRIEGVKRQDGRWVVVTSRGLIVSR
jgi:hypothetical protein